MVSKDIDYSLKFEFEQIQQVLSLSMVSMGQFMLFLWCIVHFGLSTPPPPPVSFAQPPLNLQIVLATFPPPFLGNSTYILISRETP